MERQFVCSVILYGSKTTEMHLNYYLDAQCLALWTVYKDLSCLCTFSYKGEIRHRRQDLVYGWNLCYTVQYVKGKLALSEGLGLSYENIISKTWNQDK